MRKFLYGLQRTSRNAVISAAVLTAVIAFVDWRILSNYFGFLYLFPMLLLGTALPPWQIFLSAAFCTVLADIFGPFPFHPAVSLPQDVLLFLVLGGMGMFSHGVIVNRRMEQENRRRIEEEIAARREAEEQLEFLIQTSPVAILVMKGSGEILTGNSAAHRLFRAGPGELIGNNISRYIPALGHVPSAAETSQTFRTEMQCRGRRSNGDIFSADVFFSTYRTGKGPRLAALVVDSSEDLRHRAEAGLDQLMAGSRILVAAVSHEMRNVCSAIAVVHQNLARNGGLAENQDFTALGSLVETLNKIASLELRQSTSGFEAKMVDLAEILDDARIVLEPYCEESDIQMSWEIPRRLPYVWADRHSLLQVLLNLTKNSRRAMEGTAPKMITIAVSVDAGVAEIRVTDTGPGISSPEYLFQPLQKGAEATGLGLFLSRAFMRSLGGDLRYEPRPTGCCFVIQMAVAGFAEGDQAH
jgi:PAS domain S-box-containing protein